MTNLRIQHQTGSTLLVALILLVVITFLALSGTREVTLEARITSNFLEQQKLLNDAEAALREGEEQLTKFVKPREPGCNSTYCLRNEKPSYLADFEPPKSSSGTEPPTPKFLNYELVTNDSSTQLWYALPTPSGAEDLQSENPEYGNEMMGIGTFRYEVNAQSTHTPTGNTIQLRSNVAKVFN